MAEPSKRPKKTGRPTKLTDETEAALMKAISTGCTPKDAAAYVGIPVSRLYSWLRLGRGDKARDPYRSFRQRFMDAKRKMKVLALGFIAEGFKADWKAAAWYLERTWPDEFGRRDRVRLEGNKAQPVAIERVTLDPKAIDPEDVRAAGELLAKMATKARAEDEKGD